MSTTSPAPLAPAAGRATLQTPPFRLTGSGTALTWEVDGRLWSLSHDELGERVDRWAATHLGPTRSLVVLEPESTPESVVAHLAVLQHGHVGLVVPPLPDDRRADLVARYRPDVTVREGRATRLTPRGSVRDDLHPDLALLLSTSGSTGSPRMVRLSRDNVTSNARAIADYLRLGEDDVAVTSLPLHYCYGLSVLHSHLAVGASIALTGASVVDPCFWRLAERAGVTSLAAVPHTVDLLDHSGFAERQVPSLRRVTQAGGRLAPERVRSLAELGERRGFDLVVMYGQTEATARMAWLPPHLARTAPDAVGLPVPGGHLRVDAPEPEGVGEIVYSGPNVMMGYADSAADLARGPELDELRTGDLGRIGADGLLRVTGRASRTAKVFGLRIDLDRLEQHLAADGSVRCTSDDSSLHVFGPDDVVTALPTAAAAFCGLPPRAVRAHVLDEVPLTSSGKVDHAALARRAATEAAAGSAPASTDLLDDVRLVLGRPDATAQDTFVGLGGDSLSYVELVTRLEQRRGPLPHGWHLRPLGDLLEADEDASRRRRGATVETSIALRAAAILLVVASHVDLVSLQGGAHLLLALAGWNFARFLLSSPDRRTRLRHGAVSLAQLLVPSVLWIGAVALVTGGYGLTTVLMVHRLAGGGGWSDDWQFWFLQAVVWTTVACLALLALPVVHRAERRSPFGLALALLAVAAAVRFAWVGLEAGPTARYTAPVVACFFVLGWAGAQADTPARKALVAAAATALTVGFFGQPARELLVVGGVAAMLWIPRVRLPRLVARLATTLATASLFVYLTHWQVYPPLEDAGHPWLALVASLLVGVAYGALARPVQRRLRLWMRPGGASGPDGNRLREYPQQLRRTGVEDQSPAEGPGRQPR